MSPGIDKGDREMVSLYAYVKKRVIKSVDFFIKHGTLMQKVILLCLICASIYWFCRYFI
jgi:hypothetical protein